MNRAGEIWRRCERCVFAHSGKWVLPNLYSCYCSERDAYINNTDLKKDCPLFMIRSKVKGEIRNVDGTRYDLP